MLMWSEFKPEASDEEVEGLCRSADEQEAGGAL